MADVVPGMLVVEPDARGVATLGGGVTAALYESGLRISHEDDILAETVVRGALVSAVVGAVEAEGAEPTERVDHQWGHVRITGLAFLPGRATYTGEVFDDAEESLPLELRVELAGPVVRIGVSIPRASAVVVHLDYAPATTGLPRSCRSAGSAGRRTGSPTTPGAPTRRSRASSAPMSRSAPRGSPEVWTCAPPGARTCTSGRTRRCSASPRARIPDPGEDAGAWQTRDHAHLRESAPGSHAERAHLAARAAGNRGRRWPQRLRRGGGPPARAARCRGRGLHAHDDGSSPRWSSRQACSCGT